MQKAHFAYLNRLFAFDFTGLYQSELLGLVWLRLFVLFFLLFVLSYAKENLLMKNVEQ